MSDKHGDPAGGDDFAVLIEAHTPSEANLIRALLEGAGVPAHVEGGMLADEFAVSQRLMNAQGVRVFVPHGLVERAREVLSEARVPDDELERQALAAGGEEAPAPEPRDRDPGQGGRGGGGSALTLLFAVLAGVFCVLWLQSRAGGDGGHPLFAASVEDDGVRWSWREGGADAFRQFDRDWDGVFEEVHYFDRRGRLLTVSHDADGDGLFERIVEHRRDGARFEWLDDDGDGELDRCRVLDRGGNQKRELRYTPEGFAETGPR